MLTLSLTRRQLYELYNEGAEPTMHLIESLIEQLTDFEHILGEHQQRLIDAQHGRNERLAARLKRVEEKLAQGVRSLCADAPRPGVAGRGRAPRAHGGRGTQARLAQLGAATLFGPAGREGGERRAAAALFAAQVWPACRCSGGASGRDAPSSGVPRPAERSRAATLPGLRGTVYVEEVAAEQQQWTRPPAKLLLEIKAEVGRVPFFLLRLPAIRP